MVDALCGFERGWIASQAAYVAHCGPRQEWRWGQPVPGCDGAAAVDQQRLTSELIGHPPGRHKWARLKFGRGVSNPLSALGTRATLARMKLPRSVSVRSGATRADAWE